MLVELLAFGLLRAQAALAAGCCLVLALRLPVRRRCGAEPAYRLWAIVPVSGLASVFPSLGDVFSLGAGPPLQQWATAAYGGVEPRLILALWAGGALAFCVMAALSEIGFRRRARQGRAGPAVVGVLWPRLFLPDDFESRFTPEERTLIRLHERAHVERGDPRCNLLVAALQAFAWLNPLAHVAALCARFDQELACDARVMERRPRSRLLYAAALLKAQAGAIRAPVACAWAGASGPHPLETRIDMLRRGPPGEPSRASGLVLGAGVAVVGAVLVLLLAPHSPLLQAR